MKQAQWTIAALVLAVMVFVLTFAANFIGGGGGGPSITPGEAKPVLEVDFPLGKVYPGDLTRLEQEELVPGHQDFWFVNRNADPVTMGLDKTNCKCSEVEAFVLPDGPAASQAKRLLQGLQFWPPTWGWLSPGDLVRDPALEALIAGRKGAKLKKEVPSIEVPAGGVGVVRLHWTGEKPGRGAGLQANIWMGSLEAGKLATLEVHLTFYEAVRVKLAPDEPTVLQDEDLQKGATRTIYVWSSTRPSFDLQARLSSVAGSPGAEPIEVGKPQPLTPAELEELERNNAADLTASGSLSGRVLSGYRVPVTLRSVSADGKKPFPVGPFARRVLLTSQSAGVTDKPVIISGRVEGVVEISGQAVDAGGVNLLPFRSSAGKKESIFLHSNVKDLKLEVDRERTAPFLSATVRLDRRGKGDEGQRWQLVIEALPGKAHGLFPRDQAGYKDSAVYLKALEPGKPARLIRVAVKGVAREG